MGIRSTILPKNNVAAADAITHDAPGRNGASMPAVNAKPLIPAIQRKIILGSVNVKGKGVTSVSKLIDLLLKSGQGSPLLRDMLIFLNGSDRCHLRINMQAAPEGTTLHGNTGIYVLGNKKEEPTLIQEQVTKDPWQFLLSPGFVIDVTVYIHPDQPEVQAAVTVLHELELHATHAGQLLMQLNNQFQGGGPNIDEMIRAVMAFMQQPDEHTNFDRLVNFIQSAARIRDFLAGSPWGGWAQGILDYAGRDAFEQFSSACLKAGKPDEKVVAQLEYIQELSVRLLKKQAAGKRDRRLSSDGPGHADEPKKAEGRAPWVFIPSEVAARIQKLAIKRVPLPKIIELLDTQFGVSPELTIDLYRNTVIPWLATKAPDGAGLDQKLRFLLDYGVPTLVAVDVLDRATERPSVEVASLSSKEIATPREIRTIRVANRDMRLDPDEVASDGDCLFNSLIRLGVHQGMTIAQLRTLARDHGGRAAITTAGEWAEVQDITAVATGLGIRIALIRLDLHYSPDKPKLLGAAGDIIFIAHIFGGHFTPMRRR